MKELRQFTPKPLAIAVAIAAGLSPVTSTYAAAGKVAFAWGDVTIESPSGTKADIKRGVQLESGDTVVTKRGRAQLRFTDGSFVSLQPESSFQIEDYSYEAEKQAEDRSVFKLFRGGLRTITGLIGKRSRNAYRLNTPVATIGIRGTAYTLALQADGSLALECANGSIFAANEGGTTFFNAGDVGVVLNQFTVPTLAQGEGGEQLLVLSPPPREVDDEQIPVIGDDGTPDTVTLNITGLSAEEIKQTLLDSGLNEEQACELVSAVFPDFVPTPSEPTEPGAPVVPPPIVLIDDGMGMATAYAFYCNTSNCEGSPRVQVDAMVSTDFITGTGQLESFTNEVNNKVTSRGELAFAETGANDIIAWGRWTFNSGNFTYEDQPASFAAAEESLHYVVGTPTDLMSLAMDPHNGRFSVIGSTSPTSKDGTVGTFVDGQLFVDFANNQVDGGVQYDFNGDSYDLSFADLSAPAGTFSGAASVSSGMGCSGSAGCGAAVAGLVAGDQAQNAGFVYHVNDMYQPSGKQDMFGGVAFEQDPAGPLPGGLP